MPNPTYHIACSTDDNYMYHCQTMLCSLFENNKQNDIHVHVLIECLSVENQKDLLNLADRYNRLLSFHEVDIEKLKGVKFRKSRPLSYAAYYRLLLSTLLPDISKVLYLDVDMIVMQNISSIFYLDIDNYALAAVKDEVPWFNDHREQISLSYGQHYFCSAFMLVNLKYWRENESEHKLLAFAKKKRRVYFHDQDALNYVFKMQWFRLPPKWNRFHMNYRPKKEFERWSDRYEFLKSPMIIHFSEYNPSWGYYFIKLEKHYKHYYNLAGLTENKELRKGFFKRFHPILGYHFDKFLKITRLKEPYITFRLKNGRKF